MANTDNENIIAVRLEHLRAVMRREHLAAFIIPSTDPHNSEYVPPRWEGRKWITGFTGSAGTAVVTLHRAALWTDSRYFIAAADQLRGTGYELMRERVPGTPSIAQWIGDVVAGGASTEVGIDGSCCPASVVEGLKTELRESGGLTLRTNLDALDGVWTERPPRPTAAVTVQPLEYAGETAAFKLRRIRAELALRHASGMLVAALDDIAWVTNMRGTDVHCNPVFVAYMLITADRATLYIDKCKLTDSTAAYLAEQGIGTDSYEAVGKAVRRYSEYSILIDPDEVNYTLYSSAAHCHIVRTASPIPAMKAVKNEAEAAGFRRAMLRDGVALVRFLRWLRPAVEQGGQTEMTIAAKLRELRAEQPLFRDISFDTIAGYEQHGAIVHYEADAATDARLEPHGMVLIDSGAQYADGTTDITRTIALGPVSEEQRHVYTLVLKCHLQLQNLKFPDGASGTQLDAVARMAMWREGMNFMHGTGHGVGSYLNVHEGPHQIRMEWKPAPLRAGMTVTDEPGLYLEGRFGVRTENMLMVVPYEQTEFGRFLQFEPLTLCPIDKAPLDLTMLSADERTWLNQYHRMVEERLSPLLTAGEREWLHEACSPV